MGEKQIITKVHLIDALSGMKSEYEAVGREYDEEIVKITSKLICNILQQIIDAVKELEENVVVKTIKDVKIDDLIAYILKKKRESKRLAENEQSKRNDYYTLKEVHHNAYQLALKDVLDEINRLAGMTE